MFPHVPLQAITLDLADTRSISQTVEHILNNTIYIPESDGPVPNPPPTPHTPTTATPTSAEPTSATPTLSLDLPASEEEPHPLHVNEEENEEQSVLRRRRQVSGRDDNQPVSGSSVSSRDNQTRGLPHNEGGNEEPEEDVMSFASLQRRKRELLANARRWVWGKSDHLYSESLSLSLSLSVCRSFLQRTLH